MRNKLYIAAAGAGKTTLLINEALKIKDSRVLILTYTIENMNEIKKKFHESCDRCIPANITVQTWFSFLLQHGIRPFQGKKYINKIKGMIFVNDVSKKATFTKEDGTKVNVQYSENKDFEKHFFSSNRKIYSDKLSKFAIRCNEASNGSVINRIVAIFSHIFIDEIQDLRGYDLEILLQLFASNSEVVIVGDPRQKTYSTHNSSKYKKYSDGNIHDFINDKCKRKYNCDVDTTTLNDSWRNNATICAFSGKIYSNYPQTNSKNNNVTDHDGIFLVNKSDISKYLNKFNPVQLRWSVETDGIDTNFQALNFGEAKGKGFDRVLIFPTKSFIAWLKNNNSNLTGEAKAKLYVAITRARYSVAFVVDNSTMSQISDIQKWNTPFQQSLF